MNYGIIAANCPQDFQGCEIIIVVFRYSISWEKTVMVNQKIRYIKVRSYEMKNTLRRVFTNETTEKKDS